MEDDPALESGEDLGSQREAGQRGLWEQCGPKLRGGNGFANIKPLLAVITYMCKLLLSNVKAT